MRTLMERAVLFGDGQFEKGQNMIECSAMIRSVARHVC
jgi:hypothetical protein